MYRVMIVEDEDFVREKIRELILASRLGAEVVAEATNGRNALELLTSEMAVDMVFTDIRMPIMDGLEFIERVRERDADVSIVIISGHADFEYARMTMKQEVADYLLKPIRQGDIDNTLQRLVEKIERKKAILRLRTNMDWLKNESRMSAIRVEAVRWLFPAESADTHRGQPFLDFPEMRFTHYAMIMVHIERIENHSGCFEKEDAGLVRFSFINIIEDTLGDIPGTILLEAPKANRIPLLIGGNDGPMLLDLAEDLAARIFANIIGALRYGLKIGIAMETVLQAGSLGLHAESVLEGRFTGPGSIFVHAAVAMAPQEDARWADLARELKTIESSLDLLKSPSLDSTLVRLVDRIFRPKNFEPGDEWAIRQFFARIIRILNRIPVRNHTHVQDSCPTNALDGQILSEMDGLEDVAAYLKELIRRLFLLTRPERESSLIMRINEHIATHIGTDLSLREVAAVFRMNPTYFSRMYKERTGMNYIEYLTSVRIGKAKELLELTDLSVIDVALTVGYDSHPYFDKVFKKTTGTAPLEFRQIRRQTNWDGR